MLPLIGQAVALGLQVLDKVIPDPVQREQAKLELLKAQQEGSLRELEVSMSAILAESQSPDPWTSRSRPLFYYVFYAVILTLVLIAPAVGVVFPERMAAFFANVRLGFEAIPEAMWWTFVSGFLGYSGLRTFEKVKGVSK